MRTGRFNFRGLHTDGSLLDLPPGAALEALNIEFLPDGLAKRQGFAEYEDDANGSATGIVNIFCVTFANAATYVVVKMADGTLWQRKVYPSAATIFTQITTRQTHTASEAGWGYMCNDRFHYYDSGGGSRWHPSSNGGVAYKDGMPRPHIGPVAGAAADGEKEGFYHVHIAYKNHTTREEGVVSHASHLTSPAAGAIETRHSDGTNGGIMATPYAYPGTATVIPSAIYECDEIVTYCTMGNTEQVSVAGADSECMSFVLYQDSITSIDTPACHLADHVLRTKKRADNAGGEPPPSQFGCWTGTVAIYGGCGAGTAASATMTSTGANNDLVFTAVTVGPWANNVSVVFSDTGSLTVVTTTNARFDKKITVGIDAGTTTAAQVLEAVNADATAKTIVVVTNSGTDTGAGTPIAIAETYLSGGVDVRSAKVLFSIPFFPTMVPQEVNYRASNSQGGFDDQTITPKPWVGEFATGIDGDAVEIAHAGGTVCLYGPNSTWVIRSASDGRLYPVNINPGIGCVGHLGACGTGDEVHAIGYRTWSVTRAGGFRDIARHRFRATLETIPLAYQTSARMAYYAYQDQVWCAVVKAAGTVAQRILILDRSQSPEGELIMFDPACLAAGEGISAMCQLAYSRATPTMLVATTAGRILQYPSGTADDATDFAANWRGIIAPEGGDYTQRYVGCAIHTGNNVEDNVTATMRVHRTDGDSPDTASQLLTQDNRLVNIRGVTAATKMRGRVFDLDLASAATVTERWTIHNVTMLLDREKR